MTQKIRCTKWFRLTSVSNTYYSKYRWICGGLQKNDNDNSYELYIYYAGEKPKEDIGGKDTIDVAKKYNMLCDEDLHSIQESYIDNLFKKQYSREDEYILATKNEIKLYNQMRRV